MRRKHSSEDKTQCKARIVRNKITYYTKEIDEIIIRNVIN